MCTTDFNCLPTKPNVYYLLSIKVKLNMQLNRDIVRSARLRFTFLMRTHYSSFFTIVQSTTYQEIICNCLHSFMGCIEVRKNDRFPNVFFI